MLQDIAWLIRHAAMFDMWDWVWKKNLLKDGNFFIYLPLEKQLEDLFDRQGEALDLSYRFDRHKMADDTIEDIFDGQMYKSVGMGL